MSVLIKTSFLQSILTGVCLYGTARSDWQIKDLTCNYVYWDDEGKNRFPPHKEFGEDEFVTENRHYKRFSYVYEEGITPVDLALATELVNLINEAGLGVTIKIDSASVRGLNPTLHFIMVHGDDKAERARDLFSTLQNTTIPKLERRSKESEKKLGALNQQVAELKEKLDEMPEQLKQTVDMDISVTTIKQMLLEQLIVPIVQSQLKALTPNLIKDVWTKITPNQQIASHTASDYSDMNASRSFPQEIHMVIFDIPSRTVVLDGGAPMHFSSVREFSVLWALAETNDPKSPCRDVQTLDVFNSALAIETIIRRPNDRGKALDKNDSEESVNSPISQLRNKAKNPSYERLSLLLPERGTKKIRLDGWQIEVGVTRNEEDGQIDFEAIANLLKP